MNSKRQNYKKLVNELFGEEVCTINIDSEDSNEVIGALSNEQFEEFSLHFKARLERISRKYHANEDIRNSINQALNQVADKNNWDGAYSELSVLDYFLAFNETSSQYLSLDVIIPATETLSSEMGYSNANLDGYFSNFDIYFETKVLSDKSGQLLENIIKRALKELKIKSLTILPTYNTDLPFDVFSSSINALCEELVNKLDMATKPSHINSEVIESLSYKAAWNPGVISGESKYNPLLHANNHHHLIFLHTKKFHRTRPTVLIFVNFPWFGEQIPPFDGVKTSFYRSLCSSFFEGYNNSTVKGAKVNTKINTDISAHEITKHLSAIIFIDDHSVLGDIIENNQLKAFSYINNRAINNVIHTEFFEFLRENTTVLSNFKR